MFKTKMTLIGLISAAIFSCSDIRDNSQVKQNSFTDDKTISEQKYTIQTAYSINKNGKVETYKNLQTRNTEKEIFYSFHNQYNESIAQKTEYDYINKTTTIHEYDAQGKLKKETIIDDMNKKSATKHFNNEGTIDLVFVDVGNNNNIDLIIDSTQGKTYKTQEDVQNYMNTYINKTQT
jgi:hypothetical protein